MEYLKIITGFDGAAQFSNDGVNKNSDGTFEVRPSWRSEPVISEEALGGVIAVSQLKTKKTFNQIFKLAI
jgi:hypothetical protein